MNKILEKCANVCESYMQDGNCACHCMRDSESRLVGCCAKPDIFFGMILSRTLTVPNNSTIVKITLKQTTL